MKQKSKTVKEKVNAKLEDIVETNDKVKEEKVLNLSQVELLEDNKIKIENLTYIIAANYRDAVNEEAIANRYNTILNKYDYIVGDWGYDQLRLKGFFNDKNNRAPLDKKISFLEDYLYEYCNFGCAYFVLEKEQSETKKSRNKRKKKRQTPPTNTEVVEQNDKSTSVPVKQKKNFVIKQTDKTKQRNKIKNGPSESSEDKPKTSFQIHKIED
ncbi:YutD family protein [Jeotgalibaca sp. A122]|uniref:YutD family protein n=1 Tax=Jeotgalibaca sp. A122 TaxID=3457322 RepID=UPI003FCFF7DA